jgi:hypothetical protein
MDVFSTEYLAGVVEDLKTPPSFALDRYFGTQRTFDTEAVDFDVIDRKRRIAPLVSPLVPGKVMNQVGRKVTSIKPAYVKDKRVFDPNQGFKRAVGETIGGSLTPQQRIELTIVGEAEDQLNMLARRQEVMAMEALRTGKMVLSGENYPAQTLDFLRDATLSPAGLNGGANAWDQGTSDPLANLRTWALLAKNKSGVYPDEVTMAVNVFAAFVNHAKVAARWQAQNTAAINTDLALGKPLGEAATFMGIVDGFKIFVYVDWYIDETDTEQQVHPDNWVMLAHARVDGVRAYGAIKDHDSLRAVPYFLKSWNDDDPSVRYLMLQSAPIVAPLRPNATVGVRVM